MSVTPQWALHGGRLRLPCGRQARGGGCYPRDEARAYAVKLKTQKGAGRNESQAPRSPVTLPKARELAREKQGPLVF